MEINNETIKKIIDDFEKVIVKHSKDIKYLKEKVVALETESLADQFKMSPEEVREQFIVNPPTTIGVARGRRPILESEIKEALTHVECASAAARYLGINYKSYKKAATKYGLFKASPYGKGSKIRDREYGVNSGKWPLNKILAGETHHPQPWKVKRLILRAGKKLARCERCGWKESRADGEVPLFINFIDGDSTNQKLENIMLYCQNCTFILQGDIRRKVATFNHKEDDIDIYP